MTKINSEVVNFNVDKATAIKFLTDLTNIEKILPQDKISDFKADETTCSFKVQNMATISLVLKGETPEGIAMESGEGSPFPFQLNLILTEGESGLTGQIMFEGKMNAFIEMMAKKPLQNLFDYMTTKTKATLEA